MPNILLFPKYLWIFLSLAFETDKNGTVLDMLDCILSLAFETDINGTVLDMLYKKWSWTCCCSKLKYRMTHTARASSPSKKSKPNEIGFKDFRQAVN